jgi:hypothetical protein
MTDNMKLNINNKKLSKSLHCTQIWFSLITYKSSFFLKQWSYLSKTQRFNDMLSKLTLDE